MTRRGLLGALLLFGVALGTLASALLVGRARLDRRTAGLRENLHAVGTSDVPADADADLDDLPPPVARYLSTVLSAGRPRVRRVRLEQRGEFRIGDADSPWRPFFATQDVTTAPPGFVWEAWIEMAPFVDARVVDAFVAGEGSLRATVLSTVTVADADPGPELDEGELLRYLGETPWYPTALLPGDGVSWAPIDDRSARATLSTHGTTASLVFHFGDDGLVTRVTGERPARRDDGSYERRPWSGHWRDYEPRDGMLVPTAGRAEWNGPEGDLAYWRGRLDAITYD